MIYENLPIRSWISALVCLALMLAALQFGKTSASAQGFAGLGTTADGFEKPDPDKSLVFPRDHGAHPGYRIEWWYLTANLQGADGTTFGVQWTLFRSAMRPPNKDAVQLTGWKDGQTWMAHAGLTTPDTHFASERFARGGTGQAGVRNSATEPFEAWIDDWSLVSTAQPGKDAYSTMTVRATAPEFSYTLNLNAQGPLVFHGKQGFSVKSPEGQASYYYSQPFYKVTGTLNLPAGPVTVTGTAWLDREWSSQPLSNNQQGWDWVSLHFADGAKMMGFRVRQTDGGDFTSATWIEPDGTTTHYGDGAVSFEPLSKTAVAGRTVPTHWRIEMPARGLDITVKAVNGKAWMPLSFPYWEGPVAVDGSHPGKGYLEMTGY